MKRALLALATIAVLGGAATVADAQNLQVIQQRREAMRALGQNSGLVFRMMRNEAPFNLAAVQAQLNAVLEHAPRFRTMFPDDSRTGDTEATAKIWTARAEFNAVIDKWVADARAASTAIVDQATFAAEYPKVAPACGGCHSANDSFAPALSQSFRRAQTPLR